MSEENYYDKLGLTEDASFDEIQEARGRLIQEHQGDPKRLEAIEVAYDAILMERLRMRQQGKIKVPERIRFPERLSPPAPPPFTPPPVNRSPAWLQRLVDTPSSADILWPAGLFAVLSSLVIFYPDTTGTALQIAVALGVFLSVYFLNRKERKLGRAMLLTLTGLVVGIGLGTLISSVWLAPLASVGLSADKLATLVTFFLLWLLSSFLR